MGPQSTRESVAIYICVEHRRVDRDERLKVLTAFKQVETFKVLWWENKKHGVNINDKLGG